MSSFASKDLARLQRIATDFPMGPVLDRYCHDHGISKDEARVHERELKRYFVLTARNPDRPYGMKGPVDDLWHTFLLFTEMYRAFSDALMGRKRFLHHHPCTTAKGASFPITYDGFWYDYRDAFGEAPPESAWPAPAGRRRSWEEIREEVDAFHRSNPLPPAPEFHRSGGLSIAMLFGFGWLWGETGPGSWGSPGDGHTGGSWGDVGGPSDGGGGCGGGGCGGG